jgi:hypothetical protein
MARCMGWCAFTIWLGLAMAATAAGQATVEAGLGAARAATSTAPAAGLGKAISGLAGSFNGALKGGQPDADARPAVKTLAAPAKTAGSDGAPAGAAKWEDPSGIEAGLSYDELVRRFGPPNLAITGDTGRTLTYAGKSGTFHVEVEEEKVTSVRKPKS